MLDRGGGSHDLEAVLDKSRCLLAIPESQRRLLEGSGLAPTCHDEHRRFPRLRLKAKAALQIVQSLPAFPRPKERHQVYTLDVSRSSVGFLHSEQLYPCERVEIMLDEGRWRPIEIVCCRRLGRRCYQVGATFADV